MLKTRALKHTLAAIFWTAAILTTAVAGVTGRTRVLQYEAARHQWTEV